MATLQDSADAKSAVKAGVLCGVAAPLFGLMLLFVLPGLWASSETPRVPGVTPTPWSMFLPVLLFYVFLFAGLPAAVLGVGGAYLVLGLRRRGARPFVAALVSAFIGAIAGVLWVAVPSTAGSLMMGSWPWLTLRNPYIGTAALTGMVLGFGVWLMVGRQHRA
jgi:hypothetical protein